MQNAGRNALNGTARVVAAAAALIYILAFCGLALLRMRYPFDLEWMEGGVVDHVRRVLEGKPLYVAPSVEFVPFIYAPLYFYVGAVFAKALGIGCFALRLLSFLAALGGFAIIFRLVQRETKDPLPGLLAAGLFAATFHNARAWFDLARVDSLFLCLLLAGLYTLRFGASPRSAALTAVLFTLAFHTKQSALPVIVAAAVPAFLSDRRHALLTFGLFALLAGGSAALLHLLSAGWYTYYVFSLPSQHPWLIEAALTFWTWDMLRPLCFALVFGALALFLPQPKETEKPREFWFYVTIGMLGTSYLSRMHTGGTENVLMPAYAAVAILFGLGVYALVTFARNTRREARRLPLEPAVYAVCLIQFVWLRYDLRAQLPSPGSEAAGHALVKTLAAIPGDVYVADHGALSAMAGKKTYAHRMAVEDVLRGRDRHLADRLFTAFEDAVYERRFAAVVLDSMHFPGQPPRDSHWLRDSLRQRYTRQPPLLSDPAVLWPVTGGRTRPLILYTLPPRAPETAP